MNIKNLKTYQLYAGGGEWFAVQVKKLDPA